jgi:hypothetical protein
MKKLWLCILIILMTVVVVPVAAFEWNWSKDGWSGWSHTASWSGTEVGPNYEYGPLISEGYGIHGTYTNLNPGTCSASVERTFIDSSGNGWDTITFKGLLSLSDVPAGRWMKIHVNGQEVFSGTALSYPPGNNQDFEIERTFPQSNTVTINISHGQNPCWGTTFLMYHNSLKLTGKTPVAIQELITKVNGLGLPKGIERGLLAKLDVAEKKIIQEQYTPARNTLNAFINEVNAQRGKALTGTQADELITNAQQIINAIPGN